MTPDRADCIAWLRGKGLTVEEKNSGRGGRWVYVIWKGIKLRFITAESAYRRLGGPDSGEMK